MTPALTLLAGALLVIAALGAWLWRSRREVQRLRQQGEATACNLETLQTSFARFACWSKLASTMSFSVRYPSSMYSAPLVLTFAVEMFSNARRT